MVHTCAPVVLDLREMEIHVQVINSLLVILVVNPVEIGKIKGWGDFRMHGKYKAHSLYLPILLVSFCKLPLLTFVSY